jgi:probable HAF family extracellular repeat protein
VAIEETDVVAWSFCRRALALLTGAAALYSVAASAAEMYRVTDLGPGFVPRDINDHGQIVGDLYEPGKSARTPWLLDHGTATPIIVPSEIEVTVQAINNHGLVVGWSQDDSTTRAFVWDVQQGWRFLGSSMTSHAIAINDNGAIAGFFDGAGVMSASGVVTPIDGLAFGWAAGQAMNARGDVVGVSSRGDGTSWHAFLWRDGVTRDLNVAAHIPGGKTGFEVAYDVNVHGAAVGIAETPFPNGDFPAATYAFLATTDGPGAAASLTVLPNAWLMGVNDEGLAVGSIDASNERNGSVGAIYRDGELRNLNDFLVAGSDFHVAVAGRVNNRGEILGFGWRGDEPESAPAHGLLLTPVPEPSAGVLAMALFPGGRTMRRLSRARRARG